MTVKSEMRFRDRAQQLLGVRSRSDVFNYHLSVTNISDGGRPTSGEPSKLPLKGSGDVEHKHVHTPLLQGGPPLVALFVCCFHGNVPPRSAACRRNGLKSLENSGASYFCLLGAQCGGNRQELRRARASPHTSTQKKLPPEPVPQSAGPNHKHPAIKLRLQRKCFRRLRPVTAAQEV